MATTRHRKPENWLAAIDAQGQGLAGERVLVAKEQASEALLMGLRLREGIDLESLSERFGIEPPRLTDQSKLEVYERQGLLWRSDRRIGVTAAGMPVLDALLGELVPAELAAA